MTAVRKPECDDEYAHMTALHKMFFTKDIISMIKESEVNKGIAAWQRNRIKRLLNGKDDF